MKTTNNRNRKKAGGGQAYVRPRNRIRKIADIVKYLGNGLSIGKYVNNVLRDHIDKYRGLYSIAFGNVKPVEL